MKLEEIAFPVFNIIGSHPHITEGSITYVYYEYGELDTESTKVVKLIDDKSINFPKLSRRRLSLLNKGVPLVKLGKAIFYLGDLVKLAKSGVSFIDSYGRIFQYHKTTKACLTFKRILKVIPIQTGGAILEIEGTPSRFKCLFDPKPLEVYAGILTWGKSQILYGIYEQQYKETWRKV